FLQSTSFVTMAKALLATCLLLLASWGALAKEKEYDPEHPYDPMDSAAMTIHGMLKGDMLVPHIVDGWQQSFCECVENGNIASWYQYASAMYLVDTCSPEKGFVLRTGHIQDRHSQPMQAMMTCDTLKLISYCLSHKVPEAIPMWNSTCMDAHYTVAACDANCNAAVPRASGRLGAMVAVALATMGAVSSIFSA
ncbi:unnamed protein product, partial [Polarella glacialis]